MVFSPNACNVFRLLLTRLAATVLGASGEFTHGGVSVFHQRVFRWAIEARADQVAALGLRAHAIPALLVDSVGDQSVTIRALDGVAVDRV